MGNEQAMFPVWHRLKKRIALWMGWYQKSTKGKEQESRGFNRSTESSYFGG
jgi:hypothetical protein